jgi:hypothetical protein
MRLLLASLLFAAPALLFAAPALADPIVANLDIVGSAQMTSLAVVVPSDGEPAELSISGPVSTHVKLRKAPLGLEFDVEETTADHTSFRARGELAPPPTGKTVTLARVPRPTGGTVEVQLTLR